MKFLPSIISSLAILSMTSAFPTSLTARAVDSCPIDAMSCSPNAGDSCCSPTNGWVVLSLQWRRDLHPKDAFTLHGLWPDTCSGGLLGDEGCDPSRNYPHVESILKNVPALYQEALTYWPSYKRIPNPYDKFWTDEWKKHGTCLSTLERKCYPDYQEHQDVYEYFDTALALRREYDLFSKLSEDGVTPGRNYSLTRFESAIQSAIGVRPVVTCSGRWLKEVLIYFHVKNGNQYVPTDRPEVLPSIVENVLCHNIVNYPKKN